MSGAAGGRERDDAELEETLGHRFARPELLDEALIHPSTLGGGGTSRNYERLEFLGDRVLGLVLAELLFARYGEEREGALARRHADLVRRESLFSVARAMGLGAHISLSKGEAAAGGRENPTILADCCEAVIAALYLDGGLEAARKFIEAGWEDLVAGALRPPVDAKTELQEWAQGRRLPLPSYRVVSSEGPGHSPIFSVEVAVEGLPPASGSGRTKRLAEKAAAAELLRGLPDATGPGDG